MWLPHAIHPLIDSGIILAALGSVLLNLFFNGAKAVSEEDLREAAIAGGEH
jgi:xanthine/uracil permease